MSILDLILSYYGMEWVSSKVPLTSLILRPRVNFSNSEIPRRERKACWIICSVLPTQPYTRPQPHRIVQGLLVHEAGSGHIYAPKNSVELLADIVNILNLLLRWEGNELNITTHLHLFFPYLTAASSWFSLCNIGERDFCLAKMEWEHLESFTQACISVIFTTIFCEGIDHSVQNQ